MNIRKNKYLLFTVMYILIYLLLVFVWWLGININLFNQYKSSMSKFIADNPKIIKEKIFGIAYDMAFKCGELQDATEKEICHKDVRVYIASVLDEEGLNNTFSAHPDDLMFVRMDHRDGSILFDVKSNEYYVLGWEGRVSPIAHQYIRDDISTSYFGNLLAFLTRDCKVFNIYDDSKYSCEVYQSIDLENDSTYSTTGYLVRLVTFEEETWLSLIIVLPIYLLFMPLIDITVLQVIPYQYAIAIFLALFIPLVVAFFVMKKYAMK